MGIIQRREGKAGAVSYRVLIRRAGNPPISKSFKKKVLAKAWLSATENAMETDTFREDKTLFKALVDRYVKEIGAIKPFGRTKSYVIDALRVEMGHYKLKELTADVLMEFALRRRLVCCPSTVKMDMQYIGVILSTAENMWGLKPKFDEYRRAMDNCANLQVIASSDERDRRCSDDEISEILSHVSSALPVAEWVAFSLATAMRVGEIGALRWKDLSKDGKSIIIRQRKHPRKKRDEVVPLVPEARKIIARQPVSIESPDLIFPHKPRSITHAFRKGRDRSTVEDLRYHDLRHEAISRLFELGFDSMVVATFSGHRDINMLRRYTHINANKVLKILEEQSVNEEKSVKNAA